MHLGRIRQLSGGPGGIYPPGTLHERHGLRTTPPRTGLGDQRDPVVVYWPSVFLEAWGTKAKNHSCLRTYWFCGRAAFGGKATQTSIFLEHCGLLALLPQASKKPLGQ